MSTLVVRFSSLGDVVLCGAVTGGLAPVTFLTRRAWVEVAAALPGVERVLAWEDRPALRGFSRVVDLHASPRSRAALLGCGAPVARVARHDLARRLRVAFKTAPAPRVVDRYAAAAGVPVAPGPWIPLPAAARDALVLVPGAAHATKRWAPDRFAALGAGWAGPVLVLGGPEDGALCRAVAAAVGPRADAVAERGFQRTFEALSRAAVAVAGDTGLLHLAAATGAPVVGLFGPTTAADGFWCHAGQVVERPLSCRPCARFGGPRCPVGDHLCLDGISVAAVAAAVRAAERGGP